MDVRAPKSQAESFTIVKANAMMMFSRIVGGTVTLVAAASQFGLFGLVPKEYQKQVSLGAVAIGMLAIVAGNEKQGTAIIQDRMSKPDIFTPSGKPGKNADDALHQVFMSATELALAQKAVSGELIPPTQAQQQAVFEEKLLSKIDQFKPVVFPANPPPVDMHEKVRQLAMMQPPIPGGKAAVAPIVIGGLPPSPGDGKDELQPERYLA